MNISYIDRLNVQLFNFWKQCNNYNLIQDIVQNNNVFMKLSHELCENTRKNILMISSVLSWWIIQMLFHFFQNYLEWGAKYYNMELDIREIRKNILGYIKYIEETLQMEKNMADFIFFNGEEIDTQKVSICKRVIE